MQWAAGANADVDRTQRRVAVAVGGGQWAVGSGHTRSLALNHPDSWME